MGKLRLALGHKKWWAGLGRHPASCGAHDRPPRENVPLTELSGHGRQAGPGSCGQAWGRPHWHHAPVGQDHGQSTWPDQTVPISAALNLALSSLPGASGTQRRNSLLFRGKTLPRSLTLQPECSQTRLSWGDCLRPPTPLTGPPTTGHRAHHFPEHLQAHSA